ncbi:DEAD/DEAH box helicase family protein, partial [Streptococcus iniae]
MIQSDFENQLEESLHYGFINQAKFDGRSYSPKILINNPDNNQFVLTDIQQELTRSTSFYFSVAFVTQSGIALIKSQLADLAQKNVTGKILISPYLDFNDPLAMKELLKLKNVEVRVSPSELQLHSKFYLFEQEEKNVLISGSSNLTGNALKKNYEWNIKLTSTENGNLIKGTKNEFERIWQLSSILDNNWIEKYQSQRNELVKRVLIEEESQVEYTAKITPNSMQQNALNGLNRVREVGAKKAIVVSATGTGKTYLSAFDVQQVNPDRVLFIVHREQILTKSLESFRRVLGFSNNEACLYRAGMDISEKKYVFATIQTLSRNQNLTQFASDWFDYILIDEVHKAGA